MSDDWDYERARALLRAQVAGATPTTVASHVGVALRHRVATAAGLAAVAGAVVVGSWWATTGGPVTSAAVTAEAHPPGVAQPSPGPIPTLATVGGVQVVSVPAPGGGWVQVLVGPVSATTVGSASALDAPTTPGDSPTGRPVEPAEVVASAAVVETTVRSSGGGPTVAPPPPRTSAPASTPTAPPPVQVPTTDPPASSPVEQPPGSATPPATPDTPTDQSGSGAGQSGETGTSGTS
ncbi:MAG: hypothetical protein INR72_09590 [Williamsia herbipolensis]|nr:hypothetical protein [Williamsia herbipolensis]